MNGFGSYHPIVLFTYYILALCFSMVSMHPVLILTSLAGGFLLYGAQNGWRKLLSELGFFFLLFVLMSIANPLFIHNGETILFFMNDNPITLEAMIYGSMASLMVVGVLLWCRCYGSILTTDKFLYLFGKLIPKLGLILSMAFRFIPLFKQQIRKISQSQKTMGLYASDSITDKVGGGVRVFDSLVAWSMENSIDTADAMKARGYGLPGRTNFTLFRFHKRDGVLLGVMGALAVSIFICFGRGDFSFYYYPYVAHIGKDTLSILRYLLVLLFMCIPGILELRECITWRYQTSKILTGYSVKSLSPRHACMSVGEGLYDTPLNEGEEGRKSRENPN